MIVRVVMMDEKELFGLQLLKLAQSEVVDSKTKKEAEERINRLIMKFEEKSLTSIYEMVQLF